MKLSVALFFTDILPHRRRFAHKFIKNKIFVNHSSHEVFTTLKKSGVDGIELLLPTFTFATDADLHEVKKIVEKNDMTILSVHQVIRLFILTPITEVRETVRIAKMMGAKVVVLHISTVGKQLFTQEYIAAIHQIQVETGIQIGFENMEKYWGSLHRKHSWHDDKFASLMNKNDFLITLDTTHLAHSGGDITDFFKKNKNRIVNIHLSDYRRHILNRSLLPMFNKHLPLGKGELDMITFMKTLKTENYKGLVTMEMHTDLKGICDSAKLFYSFLK
jgi:sugar phosphate isomerase/epimerase